MEKIRFGIVGAGNIANRFARAVKKVDSACLVAVAARDLQRAEAFAKAHSIEKAFGSYQEMIDSVDVVYIATQNPFHKPCAELFLNAKKHVLCEKPLCVNAEEAIVLKELAQKNGVFLMEAMWSRFLPAIKEIKRIVDSGEIGEIRKIKSQFCFATNKQSRVYKNDLAGGSLLDVGVYGLHFADLILDENPEKITATAKIYEGVDAKTTATMEYKSTAVSKVTSAICINKPEKACIYGTKGRIYLPRFFKANEFFIVRGLRVKHIKKEYLGNGFEEQIIEVCECIKNSKTESETMPVDKSIEILKQMDEIRAQIGVIYPNER